MEGAQNALKKLRAVFAIRQSAETRGGKVAVKYQKLFKAALDNDLNLPKAMQAVWEVVRSKLNLADKQATLLDFDQVLGLGLDRVRPLKIPSEITKLVREREAARKAGDWKRSDQLRAKLIKSGWLIEDTSRGPRVIRK